MRGCGESDVDVIQWFFDLEKIAIAFNWPVGVQCLIDCKRQLDALVARKASAEQVKEAYSKMASAVGPTLMTVLLESDDTFPEVNHSGAGTPPVPGRIALYVDRDGACVVAECFKEYGRNPGFSVA